MKSYRDAAKEVQNHTGVEQGSEPFNQLVRAAKTSLQIVHEPTTTGTVPKAKLRSDFTRTEFLENLRRMTAKDSDVVDPLAHMSDRGVAATVSAKDTGFSSMIYAGFLHETKALMTPSEMLAAHGSDYEHLPLRGVAR